MSGIYIVLISQFIAKASPPSQLFNVVPAFLHATLKSLEREGLGLHRDEAIGLKGRQVIHTYVYPITFSV